jgi:monofunctional biosynthetic peptidoglycan transglycosylase
VARLPRFGATIANAGRVRTLLRGLLYCLGVLIALALVDGLILLVTTPNPNVLAHEWPHTTAWMQRAAATEPPAVTSLDSISPFLVCAVIKAEDRAFFRHHGFDWPQIRKAISANWSGASSMGGSTITQQLARNLYLGPERTIHRKLREALIARRLEHKLTKRRILELYLGVIEWSDGIWGVSAASRHYFGKSPADLDLYESVFLVSLIAAPRHPLSGANLTRAAQVQSRVLYQMLVSDIIDRAQWTAASERALAVERSLARGESLEAALQSAPSSAHLRPAPQLSSMVDDECGLDRELAYAAAIQTRLSAAQP